eukprot:m.309089 g.309089  ORF g.309089 m.309089 type:complete len:116 (+) comp45475_c0_seq1:79-426(+)
MAETLAGSEAAGGALGEKTQERDFRRLFNYPLLQNSDMTEEMRIETMELCVTAVEKFPSNNEAASKMIKETMDKKYGPAWHAVIGEGFGFEMSYDLKSLLYMFFGTQSILVWKCY